MTTFKPTDTQLDALVQIQEHIPRIDTQVLAAILLAPDGATCDAIEVEQGLAHQTASSAINRLVSDGHIRDSGARRKTRSGRNAIVYVHGKQTPKEPRPCCLFCGQPVKKKREA